MTSDQWRWVTVKHDQLAVLHIEIWKFRKSGYLGIGGSFRRRGHFVFGVAQDGPT
jgi:hypothetical protein